MKVKKSEKNIPTVAFRVLDAPHLKDDFYCSVLAYCYTSHTLAVALTHKVYLWTEEYGVRYPPLPASRATNFVTSLAFSSDDGAKSILAVARHNGNVTLWSLLEASPRFEAPHPCPASCVAFRPTVALRESASSNRPARCEDLLVGDDDGCIYYYSVEWPEFELGSMNLLIKLDAHRQNVCGLGWAPDGESFITGGNDNIALFFKVKNVLQRAERNEKEYELIVDAERSQSEPQVRTLMPLTPPASPQREYIRGTHANLDIFDQPVQVVTSMPGTPPQSPGRFEAVSSPDKAYDDFDSLPRLRNRLVSPAIPGVPNLQTFALYHAAAVKAIAFAPWQANLLATGGGSNDRQIHFYHTGSGSSLAVINVFAQVTSLV